MVLQHRCNAVCALVVHAAVAQDGGGLYGLITADPSHVVALQHKLRSSELLQVQPTNIGGKVLQDTLQTRWCVCCVQNPSPPGRQGQSHS